MPFPAPETTVAAAEAALGRRLPAAHRARLIADNGGEIGAMDDHWRLYPVWDQSDRRTVARTANHIVRENRTLRVDWPDLLHGFIAIADNGNGDLLLQPYNAPDPERTPMWALRELDIVDKHRSILLTASIANIQSFGHYGDLPEPPTLGGTVYNDGDEIFRVPARTHAEARIHPTFTCDIALGFDGPYSRLPLRQATTLLYGVVSRHLHFIEYKVLGASPFDTTLYPHVSDSAPVSPRPPQVPSHHGGRSNE